MRTLTNTLLKAQQAAVRTPCLKVEAKNFLGGVVNLKWERLYTGAEVDSVHAAAMPADGSLIRIYATLAGDNRKLYRQRVASPGAASDYSQWDYLSSYGVMGVAACSLGAEVSLFWVKSDGTIGRIKSTDNGASWAAVDYPGYAPTGAVTQMAAAYKPNGDLALFFADTSTLYVIQCAGGVWQSRAAWNKTTGLLSGVAAAYNGDWKLLVSGKDTSGNYKVWSLIYGDGAEVAAGSWSTALLTISSAPSGSQYSFQGLFLDNPDTYRGFFSEIYAGSEAYNRPFWMNAIPDAAFLDSRWREPVSFNLDSKNGLVMVHTAGYAWLTTPFSVWRADLTALTLDLSADVAMLQNAALPDTGKVEIELNNNNGRYTLPGQGAISALDIGCQIDVNPGYRTPAGNEYSVGQTFILQAYEHRRGPGKASLALEAADGWSLLENWIARYQFRWNPVTDDTAVKEILTQVLARSGIKLEVISQSTVITAFYPDFAIHPGDNGRAVINRLLSYVPDVLFIEGLTAYLVNPLAADASVYAYGTNHVIFDGRYRSGAYQVNRIMVEGAGVFSESFTWTEIAKSGDILQIVEDLNADTTARTHERGEAHLRKASIEAVSGSIRIPVNCGQQLYDVIEITDPGAGLAAAKRRVLGMTLAFIPGKSIYEHKLLLGGV